MPDITLTTLQSLKQKGEKITMLTCYDATFAHTCCEAGVEVPVSYTHLTLPTKRIV